MMGLYPWISCFLLSSLSSSEVKCQSDPVALLLQRLSWLPLCLGQAHLRPPCWPYLCSPQSPSSLPATPTFSYLLRRAQLPPSLSRQFMLAPPPVGCISPPLHLVISGLDLMSELTAVPLLLNYDAMWFHDSGKFFFKTLITIFITHL